MKSKIHKLLKENCMFMSKTRFIIFTIILLVAVTIFQACGTLDNSEFTIPPFEYKSGDTVFTIEIVSDTLQKTDIGLISSMLNLDSIIRSKSSEAFNLNSIRSVKISSFVLTLLNPDSANNFANFQEGSVRFSTDLFTIPLEVASGQNADVYSESWIFNILPNAELKSYLTGHLLTYHISAKARHPTTKQLTCRMSVKFKIE